MMLRCAKVSNFWEIQVVKYKKALQNGCLQSFFGLYTEGVITLQKEFS
jgi:hypothetical protein